MINVKFPRRGFVVEEVTEGCKTEGCTASKLVVLSWEYYGEDTFNDMTEGITVGQTTCDDDNEGACPKCGKPVTFKRHFVVTSDANAIKTAGDAFYYAKDVLSAPFPEGEALIATDAAWSYKYAKDVLKAPFPEGETAIATTGSYSYGYAKDILHAPFPLGEKAIATNGYYFKIYKELFPEPQVVATPQVAPEQQVAALVSLMNDKEKTAIQNTFLTLVYTLEEIIDYDQEGGTYHFVGSLFQADNILKSIHDLMETFPNLTEDLALQEYDEVKSYMDEYSKYRKEKQEKEKPNV